MRTKRLTFVSFLVLFAAAFFSRQSFSQCGGGAGVGGTGDREARQSMVKTYDAESDSLYQSLKKKPLDQMTVREYEYFMLRAKQEGNDLEKSTSSDKKGKMTGMGGGGMRMGPKMWIVLMSAGMLAFMAVRLL